MTDTPRYTPPERPMDPVDWMQAGCALLLLGVAAFGLALLVLTLTGVVR